MKDLTLLEFLQALLEHKPQMGCRCTNHKEGCSRYVSTKKLRQARNKILSQLDEDIFLQLLKPLHCYSTSQSQEVSETICHQSENWKAERLSLLEDVSDSTTDVTANSLEYNSSSGKRPVGITPPTPPTSSYSEPSSSARATSISLEDPFIERTTSRSNILGHSHGSEFSPNRSIASSIPSPASVDAVRQSLSQSNLGVSQLETTTSGRRRRSVTPLVRPREIETRTINRRFHDLAIKRTTASQESPSTARQGSLYAFRVENQVNNFPDGAVKIGRAEHPDERIRQLQDECGHLQLRRVSDLDRDAVHWPRRAEALAHRLLSDRGVDASCEHCTKRTGETQEYFSVSDAEAQSAIDIAMAFTRMAYSAEGHISEFWQHELATFKDTGPNIEAVDKRMARWQLWLHAKREEDMTRRAL